MNDLRARILEALVSTPAEGVRVDDPEERPWQRHDRHKFHIFCALCQGDAETLADAVMGAIQAWMSEQPACPKVAFEPRSRVKVRLPGSLFDGRTGTVYRKLTDGSLYPVVVRLDDRDDSRYFAASELELLDGGAADA